MKPCRHCGRKATRPKGLCGVCYYQPAIRCRYASTSKFAKHGEQVEVLTERRPGQPTHRCLWCMGWKCAAPLMKCQDCEREYDRLAVGMPVETAVLAD